ncbi:DNA-binding NarL/FixJ family response regulator [Paucibacter oligotrophus]|uniref:DNA-binding NarL/FixJ family response regulator n=1 Tax=Roseateles oligotrophus TaxID=1769250 RepID=A0A840LFJ9_9BURK|nr:response regulator transcription factor [Roseateles oligotrophus]MBB4845775.1 DNA-binding NarL/FixJ family response regulator [Roseateles oligotrophus]
MNAEPCFFPPAQRSDPAVRSGHALVVDDHPLVARGLAQFLQSHCGFAQVHLAADGAGCQRCLQEMGVAASLVVLDFWLADGSALELVARLSGQAPQTRLLVLSGDEDPAIQGKVQAAGAHGFLLKQASPERFARVVESLLAGGTCFAPAVAARLPLARRELPLHAADLGLTERQAEVLSLTLRGLPNKRIALMLALSEATVKEHMGKILAKLGVSNRIEAINLLKGRRIEPR